MSIKGRVSKTIAGVTVVLAPGATYLAMRSTDPSEVIISRSDTGRVVEIVRGLDEASAAAFCRAMNAPDGGAWTGTRW